MTTARAAVSLFYVKNTSSRICREEVFFGRTEGMCREFALAPLSPTLHEISSLWGGRSGESEPNFVNAR